MSLYTRHLCCRSSSIKTIYALILKRPVVHVNSSFGISRKPNSILLNCLVHGETPPIDRLFAVEIAESKTVAILKKAIKEEKRPLLDHVPVDKLSLWKVSLPLDNNIDNVLEQLVLEDNDRVGIQKLLPAKKLSYYFPKPTDENLHVIVKPPFEPPRVPLRKPLKYLDATSVSGTRIFETECFDKRLGLPYGIPNFYSFRTLEGMLFADKTIYIKHLEGSQGVFRCTFLRPRRFGKTAFLSMLCAYYDIHNAKYFNDLFGPLYIGKHPTPWHNKHLVLQFDLSAIDVSGSVDQMKASFHTVINFELKQFLSKYQKELEYPEIDKIINTKDATASLREILALVSIRGHTLFVGVDEYDAPANNVAFAGNIRELDEATFEHIAEIEHFFKNNFFATLKRGCGMFGSYDPVISKYFLTGVTPAFRKGISPLHEAEVVSNDSELHGVCGFTEIEVTTLVQHYLRKDKQETDKIVNSMRRLYNGYYFANTTYDESNPQPPLLYNPQLVFHYIRTFENAGVVSAPNEYTAVHSMHALEAIANFGKFSVDDLIQLIISGSVATQIVTEFGYSELLSFGKKKDITWSFLLYLGILTRSKEGFLRIPNDVIKTQVLERIVSYLDTNEAISSLMGPAFDNLIIGSVEKFIKLLETFLRTRTLKSLETTNEAVFQSIVELILDKPTRRIPELWLVVDGTKKYGDGRHGFVDIFIPPQLKKVGSRTPGLILELKYITLGGLWSGETKDLRGPSSYEIMAEFRNKIHEEDEQDLLARDYMYWSKDLKLAIFTTVGAIMEGATKQLKTYMEIVAKGNPETYYDFGVLDSRIKIEEGFDDLQGYVIMAIAGDRVLVRSTELMPTSNIYRSILYL